MALAFKGIFGDVQVLKTRRSSGKAKKPKSPQWGCASCSLNPVGGDAVPEKNSVFEELHPSRPIWILGMNPAKNEIQQKRNFIGRAGTLFWQRVARLGVFTREQCNVDNVVRCRSTQVTSDGTVIESPPDKVALKCCHKFTLERYEKLSPRVIVLLGSVAQKQFLGKTYQKNKTVYWDEAKQCKIICLYHPSFFLRGGASKAHWREFDRGLKEIAFTLKYPGRYGYVESLDYKTISRPLTFKKFLRRLKIQKTPVAVDLEWGVVDGKVVILCAAFTNRKEYARIVFFDHPQVKRNPLITKKLKALACQFLADSLVEKVLWHGVSDVNAIRKLWGAETRGYNLDGEFIEYFAFPNRRNYQLEVAVDLRLKKMSGYKEVVNPYVQSEMNFALVPLKALKIRCCGDADATWRLAMGILKQVNRELVKMYTQASFPLDEMGKRGFLFDAPHCAYLKKIYSPLSAQVESEIRFLAGEPDFKITDEELKKLFVGKLKIPLRELTKGAKIAIEKEYGREWKWKLESEDLCQFLKEKYGQKWYKGFALDKNVLFELYDQHQIVRLLAQKRYIDKLEGTYLDGFEESAREHNGYVTTRFKQTTASSGRLASSGEKGEKKGVNMQNIHGDVSAQNILISTPHWREIENAWRNRNSDGEDE